VGANAGIGGGADPVDEGGVAEPRARPPGRLDRLDGAVRKPGRADALEVEVARKVVAAGAQRLERRIEARLDGDEAADRWRRPPRGREPHALGQFREAAAPDRLHLDEDALGARPPLAPPRPAREGSVEGPRA